MASSLVAAASRDNQDEAWPRPCVSVPDQRSVIVRPVEIIAHRGANWEAPENTLPAFQRALEIGVQGIELDVHLSRDGVPVVHHDPMLGGSDGPAIGSLELAAIRQRSDAPQLVEVLDLVDGKCRVHVEVKAAGAVDVVVPLLRDKHGWCALHSFDHRSVLRARSLDPELTTGILLVSYLVDIQSAMRVAGATDVWQQADFIDQDLTERVHAAGGRVVAWTVNDVAIARRLVALGVDAICTDAPRELIQGLSEASPVATGSPRRSILP